MLNQVADIVRRQCNPLEERPPLASRIIRAANAYDDLVSGSTNRDRAAPPLERLRLDGDAMTTPMVEAMATVIDRLVPVNRL